MTKEEKLVVIDSLAEQLQAYPHFYIADIESLNAEQTAALRRKCFESDVKLVVVKNTLLGKALEKVEKADADLVKVLEGPTSIMFTNVAKAPAVLIKEFRKKSEKPVLKAAFAGGCVYVGDDQLDALCNIKCEGRAHRRHRRTARSRRRRMLSLHCRLMQAKRLRAS